MVGARKILISLCGYCIPACAARTACLRLAYSISGMPRLTVRSYPRMSTSLPRFCPAIVSAETRPIIASGRAGNHDGRELSDGRIFNCKRLRPSEARAITEGLVVALPESTSATAILAALWLFAQIPTLGWFAAGLRRRLADCRSCSSRPASPECCGPM